MPHLTRAVLPVFLLLLLAGCQSPTVPSDQDTGSGGSGGSGGGGGTGGGGTGGGGTGGSRKTSAIGCFLGANQASPSGCGRLTSLGSPAADQAFSGEVNLQRGFWGGIPVTNVWILNECSAQARNAYADPVTREINYGYYMFHSLVAEHGNVLPVAGVLAHEWGHQIQFTYQWFTNPVRDMELEADAFSGYFMALNKGWAWPFMQSYFTTVYAIGDYNFNHPSHHGTPQQRLTMARVGFDTAVQAAQFGRPLGYADLHQIFTGTIWRLGLTAGPGPIELSPELEAITRRVVEAHDKPALAAPGRRPDLSPARAPL